MLDISSGINYFIVITQMTLKTLENDANYNRHEANWPRPLKEWKNRYNFTPHYPKWSVIELLYSKIATLI